MYDEGHGQTLLDQYMSFLLETSTRYRPDTIGPIFDSICILHNDSILDFSHTLDRAYRVSVAGAVIVHTM